MRENLYTFLKYNINLYNSAFFDIKKPQFVIVFVEKNVNLAL